jgi:hypothetical protein
MHSRRFDATFLVDMDLNQSLVVSVSDPYSFDRYGTSFGSKTTIYLSLGLHKGSPSYRRSLQPSKENFQHFKT